MYQQDSEDLFINDNLVKITSPTHAINLGIGMFHQHFMLVDTLTVTENIALGLKSSRVFLNDLDVDANRIQAWQKYIACKSTLMCIFGNFLSVRNSGWKPLKPFIEVRRCYFLMNLQPC
jgi:ABC-type uncharacterized transport system ATPase subunit